MGDDKGHQNVLWRGMLYYNRTVLSINSFSELIKGAIFTVCWFSIVVIYFYSVCGRKA